MTTLRQAAQAVLERWDSPSWSWSEKSPTADLMAALRTALEQQAEPVQEQKYEKRIAPYSTTLSMILNTTPPQRPWVGLTDEEVQFCAAQHRQLVNAHYDAASDTNVITAAFEATVFYETVEQALKERNHD